jgi:hypothetical protein
VQNKRRCSRGNDEKLPRYANWLRLLSFSWLPSGGKSSGSARRTSASDNRKSRYRRISTATTDPSMSCRLNCSWLRYRLSAFRTCRSGRAVTKTLSRGIWGISWAKRAKMRSVHIPSHSSSASTTMTMVWPWSRDDRSGLAMRE